MKAEITTEIKQENVVNAEFVGSLTNNDGVVSGFRTGNYVRTLDVIPFSDATSFDIVFKISVAEGCVMRAISTTTKYSQGFSISINSSMIPSFGSYSSSGGEICAITGSTALNTEICYLKISFKSNKYTFSSSPTGEFNGEETIQGTKTTSIKSVSYKASIGYNETFNSVPFLGSIDFKESYININGARWWDGTYAQERELSVCKVIKNSNKYYAVNER